MSWPTKPLSKQGRDVSRVKERMEVLGMTIREASRISGIQKTTWSRIACGQQSPTIVLALVIAKTLDTTLDYLFDMQADPRPQPATKDRYVLSRDRKHHYGRSKDDEITDAAIRRLIERAA